MKYLVFGFFVLVSLTCTKADVKDAKPPAPKNPEKRAAIDLPGATAYATSAPGLAGVSHAPTILPAVTATPGIVYAPDKQIIATASPAQLYAKPSPHLKISDAVLTGHQQYAGLLTNQYYQGPQFHTLSKVGFNGPSYAVAAPVAAHLAYSKHQVLPQQVYAGHSQFAIAQPQIQQHYTAAYSQPQAVIAHPQIGFIQQSQVPHLAQSHYLPQVSYIQPQVNYQPQIYHAQPVVHAQFAYAQPQVSQIAHATYAPVVAQQATKVAYAQPTVVAQQVYQPVAAKSEGSAVSYTSFSQGHPTQVQYSNHLPKVNIAAPVVAAQPAAAVLSKQVVSAPVYHQQHYQAQPVYTASQDSGHSSQLYASSSNKVAYSQPHVAYATQYFGKIAQGAPVAYAGYNH